MKNYNEVGEAKKLISEAFKTALKDKNVKKTFMKYLKYSVEGAPVGYLTGLESLGEGVFDDANPKAIQKALYKFNDITEQYWIHFKQGSVNSPLETPQASKEDRMNADLNEIWALVSEDQETEFSDAETVERIYKLLSNKSNK